MRFFLPYCIPFQLIQIKFTVEHLEAVQKTATKMIKGLTNIPSEERLKEQSLFSLEKGKLNMELIIVLKYMKKCLSDRKHIPLLLMSPEQEESDSKQTGELYVILRKPSWNDHNSGTIRDCSNGCFIKKPKYLPSSMGLCAALSRCGCVRLNALLLSLLTW